MGIIYATIGEHESAVRPPSSTAVVGTRVSTGPQALTVLCFMLIMLILSIGRPFDKSYTTRPMARHRVSHSSPPFSRPSSGQVSISEKSDDRA